MNISIRSTLKSKSSSEKPANTWRTVTELCSPASVTGHLFSFFGELPTEHETYKRVARAAGDNCSTFWVWKPPFDSAPLSALHWYHLAGMARETAIWRERGGERNQGPLCCLINHANQWWGLRRPLTCSPVCHTSEGLRPVEREPQMREGSHLCWWRVSTKDEYSSPSVLPLRHPSQGCGANPPLKGQLLLQNRAGQTEIKG